MNEPLRRRSLLPVPSTPPETPLPTATVAAVAARNGFAEVEQPAPPATDAPGMRRHRQPTGRNHQFNVKLRRDTLDFIYAEANERNIPIAQVIEEMVEALRRHR